EREVGDRLYSVVVASLARLDDDEPGPMTLRLFEIAALAACGYRYDFTRCAGCRRPLTSAVQRGFLGESGVICPVCAGSAGPTLALSARAIEGLSRLQSLASLAVPLEGNGRIEPCDLFSGEGDLDASSVDGELGRALALLLSPYLRGRLRALELM